MTLVAIYKVYKIIDGADTLIFASSNIDDAVEAARAYLDYQPTPTQVDDLKRFYRNKPTQTYTFSANNKTVKMQLTWS